MNIFKYNFFLKVFFIVPNKKNYKRKDLYIKYNKTNMKKKKKNLKKKVI